MRSLQDECRRDGVGRCHGVACRGHASMQGEQSRCHRGKQPADSRGGAPGATVGRVSATGTACPSGCTVGCFRACFQGFVGLVRPRACVRRGHDRPGPAEGVWSKGRRPAVRGSDVPLGGLTGRVVAEVGVPGCPASFVIFLASRTTSRECCAFLRFCVWIPERGQRVPSRLAVRRGGGTRCRGTDFPEEERRGGPGLPPGDERFAATHQEFLRRHQGFQDGCDAPGQA